MNWTDIKITFWMAAGNVKALVKTLNRWFTYARELLYWPVQQYNLDTAALFIIDMIAWERDIQRYNNEPEELYRLRVKHAYQNARDAGSVAGFKAIWARCGLGEVNVIERIDGEDWDIVLLSADVTTISKNETLINLLIEKYGRTCRRYQLRTVSTAKVEIYTTNITAGLSISIATSATALLLSTPSNALTLNNAFLKINGQYLTYTQE